MSKFIAKITTGSYDSHYEYFVVVEATEEEIAHHTKKIYSACDRLIDLKKEIQRLWLNAPAPAHDIYQKDPATKAVMAKTLEAKEAKYYVIPDQIMIDLEDLCEYKGHTGESYIFDIVFQSVEQWLTETQNEQVQFIEDHKKEVEREKRLAEERAKTFADWEAENIKNADILAKEAVSKGRKMKQSVAVRKK